MKRLAFFLLLLVGTFLLVSPASFGEDDFSFEERDAKKLGGILKSIIDAKIIDDRTEENKQRGEFNKILDALKEKNNIKDLLKYSDQFYRLKEWAIDTTDKVIKSKAGKGFQESEFTDESGGSQAYSYMISIPKGYKPDVEERSPILIYLHSKTEVKSNDKKRVLKEIRAEVTSFFDDKNPVCKEIYEKAIIIAPVGPLSGRKNKDVTDAAVDWEKLEWGRMSAFTAVRVFTEKMVFDRGRVFVLGKGKDGLAALKYATWYPSLFAGAVAIDSPLTPMFTENAGNSELVYISTAANDEAQAKAATEWAAAMTGSEGGPKATFVDGGGENASSLGEKGLTAISDLIGRTPKTAAPSKIVLKSISLEYSSNGWLQVLVMNNTNTMKEGDEDVPSVVAEVDRASNTFDIKTNRVGSLRIFLNDNIVDMDRPIIVNLNGKTRWEGTKERNMVTMLDMMFSNLAGNYDIYTNFIEIEEEDI